MKRVLSHPLVPLAFGLALRLFFILKYPATAGDTALYEELASNWLKHGAYAVSVNGAITPVDVRIPGYSAFLALVYALTGREAEAARLPVMLAQAAIDLFCCFVVAAIAARLVSFVGGQAGGNRAFIVALWLAALCPFTANYTAVLLTESLATCLTAVSIYLLVRLAESASELFSPAQRLKASWDKSPAYWAALFGLAVGATTLLRPESPLLLIVALLALAPSFASRGHFVRWLKLSLLSGLLCAATLSPWIVRNVITLREFQPLAPKDATLPDERPPQGFMAWEKTWLYRMTDCYAVTWKLNEENINLDDIPARAFDSGSEKKLVATLLDRHNKNNSLSDETDAEFAAVARRRTALHSLRTYIVVPFQRVLTIWFTPRYELLPFNSKIFPLAEEWDTNGTDLIVTLSLFFLNIFFLAAALWGFVKLLRSGPRLRLALVAIAAYIVIRTAFLTTVEAPEPRYVLVCFPAILAFAAVAFLKRPASASAPQRPS
ncbi:MAG TPA: hypothetical protein VKP58_04725 [Candidatus Acidoferrum sp.]|nr:hypothetical protein [Candidatus Acidoferrum sp.]